MSSDNNPENLPARSDDQRPSHELVERRSTLADLRDNALSVPVEQMVAALDEYVDRRAAFYEWLLRQLEQGVHFGVPPGINVSTNVDPKRWRTKPSLYKAGADFICDLMGLRDEYEADLATWEMMGKPTDTLYRRCRLYSRSNDKLIGEGTGARKNFDKKMDANGSIKMADKNAKVAATINSYGLSDLFTQDIDDNQPPEHPEPKQRGSAPQPKTRGQRQNQEPPPVEPPNDEGEIDPNDVVIEPIELDRLIKEWKTQQPGSPGKEEFAAWALVVVPGDWNPSRLLGWTRGRADKCWAKLGVPT
ncbi:MAG: hypothetical protein C0483_18425 [Pirellula sp.]|nr:hypothetical protein [Pirellula sp.]